MIKFQTALFEPVVLCKNNRLYGAKEEQKRTVEQAQMLAAEQRRQVEEKYYELPIKFSN
jgi:hypothetical protein